jgi:hypothetical protein
MEIEQQNEALLADQGVNPSYKKLIEQIFASLKEVYSLYGAGEVIEIVFMPFRLATSGSFLTELYTGVLVSEISPDGLFGNGDDALVNIEYLKLNYAGYLVLLIFILNELFSIVCSLYGIVLSLDKTINRAKLSHSFHVQNLFYNFTYCLTIALLLPNGYLYHSTAYLFFFINAGIVVLYSSWHLYSSRKMKAVSVFIAVIMLYGISILWTASLGSECCRSSFETPCIVGDYYQYVHKLMPLSLFDSFQYCS